jgi:hopene-associated glycosyltransferase HpnB
MIEHAVAALPLLIWLYLLLARGAFWRVSASLAAATQEHDPAAKVVAIIPARDEAAVVADTIKSILQQSYGGSIHVILVDDASADGTARVASEAAASVGAAARLTILSGAPLAPAWTGKLWAMSQGVRAAAAFEPDYLLFTDADIHHGPGNIAALVAHAQAHALDLVSYMVELSVATPAEKFLIPAFAYFFLQLYPPRWIASHRCRTAGAAGGCMLVRPQALARSGGLQAIRSQIIDDCALARSVKRVGGSIWLGLTHTAASTRRYGSLAEISGMISRSAFYQLRHSYLLLGATILGLGVTYVLPPLLVIGGDNVTTALGLSAWALMSISYAPMVRFYRLSPLWSLCLPAIALFYAGATLQSAVQYARRRGGQWKGRNQDLRL